MRLALVYGLPFAVGAAAYAVAAALPPEPGGLVLVAGIIAAVVLAFAAHKRTRDW